MINRALLLLLAASACGPQVPTHNGYKDGTTHPWTKFKTLKFDDKGEAKADGSLSYPERKRATWFGVDLAKPSSLSLKLDIQPGDSSNDDFDLGIEVLDPGNHPLVRKDLDEGDSQHDLNKAAELKDLPPGHYLIHVYLQGRLDTADFSLKATLKGGNAVDAPSDFPAEVAFAPPLPAVPITDDAPHHPTPPPRTAHYTPPPTKPVAVKPTTRAPIISISTGSSGSTITISISGAHDGQTGSLVGSPSATFSLKNCNERTCQAVLDRATPDQISHAGAVSIGQ